MTVQAAWGDGLGAVAVPAVRVPRDDDPPPDAGDRMWGELGEELARRRRAAGRSQQQLADLTGQYSRGAVSRAERGSGDMARPFWEIVGRLLGVGDELAARYDEIRACLEPGKRAAVRPADGGLRCELALKSAESRHAIAAYRRLGWPVAALEGRVVAAAFITALREGQRIAATDRPAVEQALIRHLGISPMAAAVMSPGTYPTGPVDPADLERVGDLMQADGLLSRKADVYAVARALTS